MKNREFNEAERAAVDGVLGWAKSYEFVWTTSERKLIRVITPQDEEQFYTLIGGLEPELLFHEPVYFVVTVQAAKGECRSGHKVGDRWEFSWCTPGGLCGSAYNAMYPVLHGLMLTSGRYEGPAADETLVTCPDDGWITFHIERHRWAPALWEQERL